ncbi:surface antigen D15 domain-containing protein (plasmid) [Chondrocystis sp. NIES-4102]|nr:surface antigen D15 domain-containing protein [Chondrocystis sp. NIES-4102]
MSKTLKIFVVLITNILFNLITTTNMAYAQSQTHNSKSLMSFEKSKKEELLFKIRDVEIIGNTVYSDTQLKQLIGKKYLNKQISLETLLKIRTEISNFYINQGYISSGAFIPPQHFKNDGKLVIRVVEGKINKIQFNKKLFISEKYLRNHLPISGDIFNINELKTTLLKLSRNSVINKINVDIAQPRIASVNLYLNIIENPRFTSNLALSNSYAKNIGSEGVNLHLNYHLLGYSDLLSFNITKTAGLAQYTALYSFPINNENTNFQFGYTHANSKLVNEELKDLNIQSNFNSYSFSIEQPILDGNNQLNFKIGLNLLDSESFVLKDLSFSFVEGVEDGKNKISEIFLQQQLISKSGNNLLNLNSVISGGLNIFNPTITKEKRDGIYLTWELTAENIHKFNNQFLLVNSIKLQLTPDQLLPSKQFTIGGQDSVRGYNKNLFAGDNGITVSNEIKFSIFSQDNHHLELIGFLEGGTVWNNNLNEKQYSDILSTGIGIEYTLKNFLYLRADYGIPLINNKSEAPDNNNQNINILLLVSSKNEN